MRIGRQLILRSLAVVATSAAVIGCGGDPNRLSTVPASGTVTYGGQPVASGSIQFVPGAGRPASGAIKDGHFTLTTYDLNDGAVPGKHRVGVSATKTDPAKLVNGEPEVIYLVPLQFASPDTSGLTAEVPAGGSSEIKIEIGK